jgi:hypothetical protein
MSRGVREGEDHEPGRDRAELRRLRLGSMRIVLRRTCSSGTPATCRYWPTGPSPKPKTPVFELIHRRRGTTYWVRVVPTPRLASVLLEEHGELTQRPLLGNQSH